MFLDKVIWEEVPTFLRMIREFLRFFLAEGMVDGEMIPFVFFVLSNIEIVSKKT